MRVGVAAWQGSPPARPPRTPTTLSSAPWAPADVHLQRLLEAELADLLQRRSTVTTGTLDLLSILSAA